MRLALVVLVVVSAACKRTDPHANERAAAAAPSPAVDVPAGGVAAGSLVAPSIEVWFGVMLPVATTPAFRAALEDHARGAGFAVGGSDPATRWLLVKDADPVGAGYTATSDAVILHVPDADKPKVRATTAAVVIGAGGPSADLDAIHGELVTLARRAAVEGHGWILDEQTGILFDVAGFDEGPAKASRDAWSLIAFSTMPGAVETMGMARFGLPEVRVVGLQPGMMGALQEPLHAATQALIDHGGLTTDGVLDAGPLRWTVDWTEAADDAPRMLLLTPPGGADQLEAAITTYFGGAR